MQGLVALHITKSNFEYCNGMQNRLSLVVKREQI